VEYDGTRYDGVANVGYSPTFDNGQFNLEVHILDFNDQIYGQPIRVNFVTRLRGEVRFPSPEALSIQIREDIKAAKEVLARR